MFCSQTNVVEVNLFRPYAKLDFSEVVNFPYYWLPLSCVSHLLVGDVQELGREVVERFVNFCIFMLCLPNLAVSWSYLTMRKHGFFRWRWQLTTRIVKLELNTLRSWVSSQNRYQIYIQMGSPCQWLSICPEPCRSFFLQQRLLHVVAVGTWVGMSWWFRDRIHQHLLDA